MKKRFLFVLLISFVALSLAACAGSDVTEDVPIASLTDYQVVDLSGATVAEVEEVLLATDSGQINYAVLDLQRGPFRYGKAAFIDASVPRTAVPWDWFTIDAASKQLQLQSDRATLYAAPLLIEKPTHLEAGWDTNIQAYWGEVESVISIGEMPEG